MAPKLELMVWKVIKLCHDFKRFSAFGLLPLRPVLKQVPWELGFVDSPGAGNRTGAERSEHNTNFIQGFPTCCLPTLPVRYPPPYTFTHKHIYGTLKSAVELL